MSRVAISGKRLVLGILASGRGSNLQAIIDAIEEGELCAEIGVVLSNKKEAQALQRAQKYQIPAISINPKRHPSREAYDAAVCEALEAHHVDLVVLAGYMRLLTRQLLGPFEGKIINIHPSLLPAFPGLNAQRQALAYGVKVSGCTVHFVDEEMDHGPIIAQSSVSVLEDDTESSLSERILVEEHRLLPEVIRRYEKGMLAVEGRIVHKTRSSKEALFS